MKIHHLNCATLCPLGHHLIPGVPRKLVCHCLLIEGPNGLILVDTGFGKKDILHWNDRIGLSARLIMGPRLKTEETAIDQVRKLGFQPEDVRHIILTHLDMDHAGGVADFPHATVHLMGAEYVAAFTPDSFMERHRYRKLQWSGHQKWEAYSQGGEKWFGFESVRNLRGLPPEILLVPLPGHSLGHAGVAIFSEDRWIMHAGDAYFHRREMDVKKPKVPWSLGWFQNLVQVDADSRLDCQKRLRQLITNFQNTTESDLTLFCSHDPKEFERLSSLGAGKPSS